jgi:hypothetical protein
MQKIIDKTNVYKQQQIAAELPKSGTKHLYSSVQWQPITIMLPCLAGLLQWCLTYRSPVREEHQNVWNKSVESQPSEGLG